MLVDAVAVWPKAEEEAEPAATTTILELPPSDAVRVLVDAFGGKDCALTPGGVEALVREHPAYETSFEARHTGPDGAVSSASIHLWNASHLGGFEMSRVFIPTRWLDQPAFGAAVATAAATLATLCARWLWQTASAGHMATTSVASAGALGIMYGAAKAAPTALFIRRVLANSNYPDKRGRLRARLFGAAHSGPHGLALLAALVRHARNAARAKGFDMLVLNMDKDDPARRALGKASFFTEFHQKALRNPPAGGMADLPMFDPAGFFDPRDIS